jgi:glycosyltransferase involved in cell wall biosynthesis
MPISLLLPSRKRPEILKRMVKSVRDTSKNEVEIIVRFDDDDEQSAEAARKDNVGIVMGPRLRAMTIYWNECFVACSGSIVCQANDDIVFTTPGWDVMLEDAFKEVPDKIMLAHGSDVFGHGSNFGPHAFVHRKWVTTLGYFIAPYFSSDFGDAWICELANMIGRRRFLNFNIEHHHFSQGMAELDENTRERLQRHAEDDPETLYYSPEMAAERQRDASKLAAVMQRGVNTTGWVPPHNNIRSAGMCQHCGSLSTVSVGVGKFYCNCCGRDFVWRPRE